MSLLQLTEHVYVYRGGVNFGVLVAPEKRLVLIDSGLDAGNARKALRPFLDDGYTLAAIINTHSHADHIGGNAELVKRTGCEVYAPARERPFILWPELEPLGLYGGAWPPPSMHVKFLRAAPTPAVLELPPAPCKFAVAGLELELIPTPGHALEQVAIALDGVVFAGDAIFNPTVIDKHPIIFLVNVADYRDGLARLGSRHERYIVPGHGDIIDREVEEGDPLPAVVTSNYQALDRLQAAILTALARPLSDEELLCQVTSALGKVLGSEPQYFLDRAAIAAHVSELIGRGQAVVEFQDGRRLLHL